MLAPYELLRWATLPLAAAGYCVHIAVLLPFEGEDSYFTHTRWPLWKSRQLEA